MTTGKSPTKKQLAVAKYMRGYLADNDNMPTMVQIAAKFGVAKNTIVGHLNALERYKVLERAENPHQLRFVRGVNK